MSTTPLEDSIATTTAPEWPILAFAGRIASGKSGLARTLGEHLGVPVASFPDYVRRLASHSTTIGTEPPRVLLQKIGADLAADPVAFCDDVIGSVANWMPSEALIVDGIRHLTIWQSLKDRFRNRPTYLIYVDSGAARRESLLRVEGYSSTAINQMATDSTENDLHWDLAAAADVVLDEGSPDDLLADLAA